MTRGYEICQTKGIGATLTSLLISQFVGNHSFTTPLQLQVRPHPEQDLQPEEPAEDPGDVRRGGQPARHPRLGLLPLPDHHAAPLRRHPPPPGHGHHRPGHGRRHIHQEHR